MKLKYILTCLMFVWLYPTFAQQDSVATGNVEKANQLYSQGQFSDAAKLYEEELKKGVSPHIYYNLGNSYYKTGEIGLAILNYERALRLDPRYRNARYNLSIAQDKVVDSVDATPAFWIKRITRSFIGFYSSNSWAVVSFIFFLLMLASFFVFAFSQIRKRRKIGFYVMIISGVVFIFSFVFSGIRKDQFVKHNEAIILNATVIVKSSPDKNGSDLFQLHEGSKVTVKSTLSGWSEIEFENGAIGWVEESTIARI